jgi:hypothetical protein
LFARIHFVSFRSIQDRLVLSYTRLVLGERSPLGRAAALLARCPPPTTANLDLQCSADRHPSSPFALLPGSSVGQRGIFAQTTSSLYLQNKLSPYPITNRSVNVDSEPGSIGYQATSATAQHDGHPLAQFRAWFRRCLHHHSVHCPSCTSIRALL